MDRQVVGKLLSRYIDSLESAARNSPHPYLAHLETARRLASRWLGGERIATLRVAVQHELAMYDCEGPLEAEDVGRALRNLCDGIGLNA